jgi:hypothetical protein
VKWSKRAEKRLKKLFFERKKGENSFLIFGRWIPFQMKKKSELKINCKTPFVYL